MPCTCRLCERYWRVEDIRERGDVAEMRELITELHDTLGNVEADLEYDEAALHGSWPSAREILTAALAKCRPEVEPTGPVSDPLIYVAVWAD